MKIYFSHSRSFNFKDELYLPAELLFGKEHVLIFPHADEHFMNSQKLLKTRGCDLVVAEVSYPSTGQGMELVWASENKIPILAFYRTEHPPTTALGLVCPKIRSYSAAEDLQNQLGVLVRERGLGKFN